MRKVARLVAHVMLLAASVALAAERPAAGEFDRGRAEQELRRRQAQLDRLRERLREHEKALGDLGVPAPESIDDAGPPRDARVLVRSDADRHGRAVYTIEADSATLKEVLDHIAAAAGRELILDKDLSFRALSGLVTVALDAATLREALDLLLGRFDLDCTLGDAGIVVTPPGKGTFRTAEERLRDAAERAYQMALVKFPDSDRAPHAHLTLGQHLHARQLYPQAIEQLERLLKDYPDCEQAAAAIHTMAQSYAALGDGERSVAAYRLLASAHRRSALADDALLALANGRVAAGQPAEAIPLLEEIVERYPDGDACLEAQVRLGECLLEARRHDDALARFGQLLGAGLPGPQQRRVALLRGRALLAKGSYPEAREALYRLKGAFPGSPEGVEAYYLIAEAFLLQENSLAAIEAFRGALAESPDSPHAEGGRMHLGDLYRGIALHDQAIAAYEAILAANPTSTRRPAIVAALGECYWGKGNLQKAQLHFERAAGDDDDPTACRARLRAARAALADRRPADAVAILQRVVGKAQDKALLAEAYDTLGDCHRRLGRLEEALAAYRRAAALAAEKGDVANAK